MARKQVVRLAGFDVGIAPFAFQFYARDSYRAYKAYPATGSFSPARLFLLARSIELAAKALYVSAGRTAADLHQINHDLLKACDPSILSTRGISLAANEEMELKKANEYYSRKGFEYFFFRLKGVAEDCSGPQAACTAPGFLDTRGGYEGSTPTADRRF